MLPRHLLRYKLINFLLSKFCSSSRACRHGRYDQNLGVVLLNHGGRQLDFARSRIEPLDNSSRSAASPPNDRFQLFIDEGVRRATDALETVALGATAGAYLKRMDVVLTSSHTPFQWGQVDDSCMRSRRMASMESITPSRFCRSVAWPSDFYLSQLLISVLF